jgi:cytochrome c biogenesis protein ResB
MANGNGNSVGWHVRDFARMHPFWSAFIGLVALGVVTHYWWFFALVAAVGVGVKVAARLRDRAALRAREDAAVVARAQFEHEQFMAGNPIGLYGQYPPAS